MWQDILKVRNVWLGDEGSYTFSDKRALYFVWNFFQEDINKTDSFFRDNYFTHEQFSSWDIDEDLLPFGEFAQYRYSYNDVVNRIKEEFYAIRVKILLKNEDNITEEEQKDLMMGLHDRIDSFTHVKMSKERLYELYNNAMNNQTMDDKRETTKINGKAIYTALRDRMAYIKHQLVDLVRYVGKRNFKYTTHIRREDDGGYSGDNELNIYGNLERDYKLHLLERYG